MGRDLTREQLVPAVGAWLYHAGYGGPLHEVLAPALGWLAARWDEGDEHLPLGLVLDLGLLLLRGRDFPFASARSLAQWPADERAGRLAYEDKVLGRWALDPTVAELHVALAGMAERHRDAAVAHAVGLALGGPLRRCEGLVLGNSAHLRSREAELLAALPAPGRFDEWAERLDEGWRAWGRAQLERCLEALPAGRLFRPEHVWEVAHLPELPSDSARLALREVHAVAAHVGPVSAATALFAKRRSREVPVDSEESDHYPAGGFDAVSTKGTFENLVRSEIAYVGEGREEAGIDLFDVRFAEGELLYYTRDESPLLDARRDVALVLDRPAQQRFKQAALPEQALVLAQGLALALQADLLRVFGPAGSRVRVVWRCEASDDAEAAEEERALLQFALAAELAHRRVELALVHTWSAVPEGARLVLSPRAADPDAGARCWVRNDGEEWLVEGLADPASARASSGGLEGAGPRRFDLRGDGAYPALRALCDALLLAVALGASGEGAAKKRKKRPAARGRSAGR